MINFTQKTLPNNIRLISCPQESTEAVAILLLVTTGGRYEPKDKLGISHFLEHLFFKGTKKYPSAQKLARQLDRLGANYNAYTSEEATGFYIQSSAKDFKKSLDLLAEMYFWPLFPEKEIDKERYVIIEEANMRRDVPQIHVQTLAQKQMFPASPLGEDLIGTSETLKNISRRDLLDYFNQNYNGSSTIIAVCGNPKNYNWETEIKKRFTTKAKGLKPECEIFRNTKNSQPLVAETRKVDQAHLVLSTRTFPRTDPRRYQLELLNVILGGSMSSRLFEQIREKRAFGYYVKSDFDFFYDTGLLSVSAGVKVDKISETTKIILSEFQDIARKGPKTEELSRAKSNLRGQIALALEGSLELATYLAAEVQYEKEIRQPERIASQISNVTSKQIKNLAQELFVSDKMGLAVIAPKINKAELSKIIKNRS